MRRKEKAVKLANATLEMMNIAPPAAAKQAAFALCRGIFAHALDYDAGVLPSSDLLPHARDLDQYVLRVAAATFDMEPERLTATTILQMRLPVSFGGLQLDLPSHVLPLARVARLVEAGPPLRAAVTSWEGTPGAPEINAKCFDGVDEAVAGGIQDMLRERGIETLGGCGRPISCADAAAADPLRPAVPERHLLSKYLRHSASISFLSMLDGASARDRTRLWSASGPTSGRAIVSELNVPGVAMADRQWTEAVRWRLGIPASSIPESQCLNVRAKNEEACGEALDRNGDHALVCPCGPFANFRHNDIAEVYAEIFEEAGAYARREVFVPELTTTSAEAWLDVWAFGVPEIPDCLVDVTVRHPCAGRYQPAASLSAGSTAREAEREKDERYPARAGRCVWPVAHETWGRLGERAEALLVLCAAAVTRRAHRRGRMPGNCLRRWRAQLDAALMRGVAAQLVSSRHGVPGRARKHLMPQDPARLEELCALG